MKYTMLPTPEATFKPIAINLTFENAKELITFLKFHRGYRDDVDGLSVEVYDALHVALSDQGLSLD